MSADPRLEVVARALWEAASPHPLGGIWLALPTQDAARWIAGNLLAAADSVGGSDEKAARLDERELLSARVAENGWCPTCGREALAGCEETET